MKKRLSSSMLRSRSLLTAAILMGSTLANAGPVVVTGTGSIASALATFQANIGGGANNANTPGTQPTGHREINWDAGIVPVLPALLPGDFFNSPPTTRGLVMTTPGTGFQVSATNFTEVNPNYSTQFSAFSPAKTFAAQGSNITDVFFRVPGSSQQAFVRGFGVIFVDVDLASSTSLQFFGGPAGSTDLGTFSALPLSSGFSFLGVSFNAGEQVTKVRITAGSAAIGAGVNDISAGAGNPDLVIMDDFLYSEPQAVPEPSTITLLGVGLLAAVSLRRCRTKQE